METSKYLAILAVVLIMNSFAGRISKRTKRFLAVFPGGGTFKIVFGLAIPVSAGLKQSITASLNFQFQYPEPDNITRLQNFPPVVSRSREKRDDTVSVSDRSLAYQATEDLLNRYGINGRACLLRDICENAMNSVYHKANGLHGHLLHIFLTPDYGDGEYDDDLDWAYSNAQRAGAYGVDCFTMYPECPYGHGILDVASTFIQ